MNDTDANENEFVRLSQSSLFEMMNDFYSHVSIDAWKHGIVPSFVTQNTFIAHSYVQLILGYIQDLHQQNILNENEPFYIIEVGGGSGRLAFYICNALKELQRRFERFIPFENIIYVLTDFCESNVSYWQTHSGLEQFVKENMLDFAQFDAVHDSVLKLKVSNVTLNKHSVVNPTCVIGNYVIDTLSQDSFRIEQGLLKEGLVSVRKKDNTDPQNVDAISNLIGSDHLCHLETEYRYNQVDARKYYHRQVDPRDEELLESILKWYQSYFSKRTDENKENQTRDILGATVPPLPPDASMLLPIGFIKAIRNLTDLSSSKTLFITGDKGILNPDRFRRLSDPHVAFHGSVSFMANFHAIQLYCLQRGGHCVLGDQDEVSIMVNAFVFDSKDEIIDSIGIDGKQINDLNSKRNVQWQYLNDAFQDYINSFGPNEFYYFQKTLRDECQNPSLQSIISLLKLSHFDCKIFYKFRLDIINGIGKESDGIRAEFQNAIHKLWKNYYHMNETEDVAFELGRLFYGLFMYKEAIEFYQHSIDVCGRHFVTFQNMGMCYASLDDNENAKHCLRKAISLNPNYTKAIDFLEKLENGGLDSVD